ncbi:MAG: CopL family metal-binding regulatory protein [Rudaea sp.]
MRHCFASMKPLPLLLRWVLAVVLVLNGALAPLAITHATTHVDSTASAHVASKGTHCHHDDASTAADSTKDSPHECPCCDGSKCECGCISSVALPTVFPDLRPLAPQAFAARWSAPGPLVSPPSRLLRPPIA